MIDAYVDEAPGATQGPAPVEEPEAKRKPRPKPQGPKYEVPTLGRIIHVVADVGLSAKLNADVGMHLAAIVTGVWGHQFNASVFSPRGNPAANGVVFQASDENAEGVHARSWHWPERD